MSHQPSKDRQSVRHHISMGKKDALIVVHRDPDLDAIGSALAFSMMLDQFGTKSTIWMAGQDMKPFLHLPHSDRLSNLLPLPGAIESIYAIDCAQLDRIKDHKDLERYTAASMINIDHHPDNTEFGIINLVEIVSSVGELLTHFFSDFVTFTPEMAECLYRAIIFDTGRFQHSSVTAQTLLCAAKLVEAGANPNLLAEELFCSNDKTYFSTIGRGLEKFTINEELGYAYTIIPNCDQSEGYEMIDFIRTLKGVEVFLVFRELPNRLIKVNLRSRSFFDVSQFSHQFGGGGHKKASGIAQKGDLMTITNTVIAQLENELRKAR